MRKLKILILLFLFTMLISSCKSSEQYIEEKQTLEKQFSEAFRVVGRVIQDRYEADTALSEEDYLLLERLEKICQDNINLRPSKEFKEYHGKWSQMAKECINISRCLQKYISTNDTTQLTQARDCLECCAKKLQKARAEFQAVMSKRLDP